MGENVKAESACQAEIKLKTTGAAKAAVKAEEELKMQSTLKQKTNVKRQDEKAKVAEIRNREKANGDAGNAAIAKAEKEAAQRIADFATAQEQEVAKQVEVKVNHQMGAARRAVEQRCAKEKEDRENKYGNLDKMQAAKVTELVNAKLPTAMIEFKAPKAQQVQALLDTAVEFVQLMEDKRQLYAV